jgi:hypothetical protein
MNFVSDVTDARLQKIDNDIQSLIPIDAPVRLDTDKSHNIAKKLREFYLGNQPISGNTKVQYANVCILISHRLLQFFLIYHHLEFQRLNENLLHILYFMVIHKLISGYKSSISVVFLFPWVYTSLMEIVVILGSY